MHRNSYKKLNAKLPKVTQTHLQKPKQNVWMFPIRLIIIRSKKIWWSERDLRNSRFMFYVHHGLNYNIPVPIIVCKHRKVHSWPKITAIFQSYWRLYILNRPKIIFQKNILFNFFMASGCCKLCSEIFYTL